MGHTVSVTNLKPKIEKQCRQSDDLMETEETKSQANLDPTLKDSKQLKASVPALSEETGKELDHSLSGSLNNMFKDIFTINGNSGENKGRLVEANEGNSLTE